MTALQSRLASRDADYWRHYVQRLLFCLALGLGLMAVMSFVAHNWTYLATLMKLGLIFGLLLIAAVVWIWKGLDNRAGASAGLVAQIMIGVWLAAAGQLYQAPGGVQTLMINWAMLGLPFVIASRNAPHWALWFGLIFIASVTSPARFMDWAEPDLAWRSQFLIGGLTLAAAFILSIWRRADEWFCALIAAGAAVLLSLTVVVHLFDDELFHPLSLLAILATWGAGFWAYRQRAAIAGVTTFTVAAFTQITIILLYFGLKTMRADLGEVGYTLLIVGGATVALYQTFTHILRHYRGAQPDEASIEAGPALRPWYMDAFIAIGGVLTAIIGATFLASFLGIFLAMTEMVELGLCVIGASLFAGALYLRLRTTGVFLQYLIGTGLIIGAACLIGGMGALTGSLSVAAIVALIVASVTLWLIPDAIMQVISALTVVASIVALIADMSLHEMYPADIPILITIGAMALFWLCQPMKNRLTAFCVMWVGLIFASLLIGQGFPNAATIDFSQISAWGAIVLIRAGLAVLLLCALKRFVMPSLPSYPLLFVLALLGGLMPPGGVAVIVFLLIGIAIGSRTLALIGSLIFTAWVLWTYFDLSLTLMQLSGAFALGAVVSAGLYVTLPRVGGET